MGQADEIRAGGGHGAEEGTDRGRELGKGRPVGVSGEGGEDGGGAPDHEAMERAPTGRGLGEGGQGRPQQQVQRGQERTGEPAKLLQHQPRPRCQGLGKGGRRFC